MFLKKKYIYIYIFFIIYQIFNLKNNFPILKIKINNILETKTDLNRKI